MDFSFDDDFLRVVDASSVASVVVFHRHVYHLQRPVKQHGAVPPNA